MNPFFAELKFLLEKVLIWSDEFRRGKKDYSFDVDNEIYELARTHNRNFNHGDFSLLYNLLDFYCDAIKHDFKEIDKGYSVNQAKSDIVELLANLENTDVFLVSDPLRDRLKSI